MTLVGQHVKVRSAERVRYQDAPNRTVQPDITFMDEKVAVFYDGCYWHECPQHHPFAKKGTALARDRNITAALMGKGWLVIRMWEHEDIAKAAALVVESVLGRRKAVFDGRAEHVAAHDPKAWCQECEQWPHIPWPIGLYDHCMRCGMSACDHEPIDQPAPSDTPTD